MHATRTRRERNERGRIAGLALVLLASVPPAGPARASDVLQCVPFARALSSVALRGDAWRWWSAAGPRYERGQTPRAGAVLSFRPDGRMPRGHVAVVTRVVGAREIEVDHANWASPGAISRGVQVIDISAGNDWTLVRVELGARDRFGAAYATNGFIYGNPLELGPQIVDVTAALRANSNAAGERLPLVIEGGRIVAAPAGAAAGGLPLPVVIYLTGAAKRELSHRMAAAAQGTGPARP